MVRENDSATAIAAKFQCLSYLTVLEGVMHIPNTPNFSHQYAADENSGKGHAPDQLSYLPAESFLTRMA